jgi:hypothetical protein
MMGKYYVAGFPGIPERYFRNRWAGRRGISPDTPLSENVWLPGRIQAGLFPDSMSNVLNIAHTIHLTGAGTGS